MKSASNGAENARLIFYEISKFSAMKHLGHKKGPFDKTKFLILVWRARLK